jgi:hypothetical protein
MVAVNLEGGSRVEEAEVIAAQEPAMRSGSWRVRLVFRSGAVVMGTLAVVVLSVGGSRSGVTSIWDLRAPRSSLAEEANAAMGNYILSGQPPDSSDTNAHCFERACSAPRADQEPQQVLMLLSSTPRRPGSFRTIR